MAVKFFGMFKELKNISVYLSNGKKQSRIDDSNEILSPSNYFYDNLNNNNENFSQNRFPNCSTSSSIGSTNSTSSYDSNDKQSRTLSHHKIKSSSASSQISSGYSTLKSKTDLDKLENQSNKENRDINLGTTENIHVKPTDFEFLKIIGSGSFGKVLLARHKKEEKEYAVKVLQKKMIINSKEESHIMCERNVLLQNLNHPFLVGLHYSFQTKDKLYFILELVNGGELYFHLQKEKSFSESRACFYAAEIACALGYLHSNNIIYRDLKPENILLDNEGHITLTDFGLCKDGLKQSDTTGTICGTIEYLSPEILKKEPYGWAVDWWTLGCVTYEMLYGLPPFFSSDNREMVSNILHKPVQVNSKISIYARNIIIDLLEKDKNNRLGSINDVEEIKNHEFFRSINWSDLEKKKIKPPFDPKVKNTMDLKNISTDFTHEQIPNSLCKSSSIGPSSIPEHAFQGFSYAAPNLLN